MAWICLVAAGCGGGDVPDPEADSSAATEPTPEGGESPPPAVAEAAPAAGRPGAMAPGGPLMAPGGPLMAPGGHAPGAEPGEDADSSPEEPAVAEAAKSAAKSEGGSSTAEMLAMATGGPAGGADAAPAQNPQAGGQPGLGGPPGGSGGMAGYPGMGQGMQRPGGPGPNMAGNSGYPGAGGSNDPQAQMRAAMQAQMQNRGGAGGSPGYPGAQSGNPGAMAGYPGMGGGRPGGMPGAPGGPGANQPPGDTRTPRGAVQAFLNALKAKDRDRLAEATALRSQQEAASQKTKELFAKIVDMSISDSELDVLSKQFEGFQVKGENAAKSTGRLGIYVDKEADNGSVIRRTLTVRKEKKGWGVMDVSAPTEFRGMRTNQQRPARG